MNDEETKAFKKMIGGMIDLAVSEMGGITAVRDRYKLMPGQVDFIAGWVVNSLWCHRQAALERPRLADQEETRRIYDLVRLRLESESNSA